MADTDPLFETLLRVGDDHLVLGHRLSEWCGHAPMLEEDLALPNIALDLIGQARALYTLAGQIEGAGRDEDAFAYRRDERGFRNLLLVERPNGDFAHTMLRQFYFSAYMQVWWRGAETSANADLAAIAGKAVKEAIYHVRHAAEWVIRLGDGTDESHRRMTAAIAAIAPYAAEMFEPDTATRAAADAGIAPDPAALRADWERLVDTVFAEATVVRSRCDWPASGGRRGQHTEDLGHMLAVMQSVHRAHPGATW